MPVIARRMTGGAGTATAEKLSQHLAGLHLGKNPLLVSNAACKFAYGALRDNLARM